MFKKKKYLYSRQLKKSGINQGIILTILILIIYLSLFYAPNQTNDYRHSQIPDFSAIQNFNDRKEAFTSFLVPKIKQINSSILHTRQTVLKLIENDNKVELCAIAKDYHINCKRKNFTQKMLNSIDIIPEGLVLAQAILESGWGTSRFARSGLNLFGIWCFSKGCGMIPNDRDEAKNHEIKSYATIHQSIEDYFNLLNASANFNKFRQLRGNLRKNDKELSALELAKAITNYSSIGDNEYTQRIRKLILIEKLDKNKPFKALH